jgi:transposase
MPPRDRQQHDRAFTLYLSLGEKRTYKQVAERLRVSVSTVKNWSRKYNWQERVQEQEAEVARKVADQAIDSQANLLARDQKIVHMALVKLAKGIAEDRVKLQASDLDRLIRLRTYLDEYRRANNPIRDIDDVIRFLLFADAETHRELARRLRSAHGTDPEFQNPGAPRRPNGMPEPPSEAHSDPRQPGCESPSKRYNSAAQRDKKVQLGESSRN